ncbi:MAG: 5-methyltetrahydrofolate--homocysteine methyltransferase [Bacteroidaceae bacterium]|nr:5-methyltetrahydrofolate--homocysteine methyltransferase [Bacteroidaceae bacterium]
MPHVTLRYLPHDLADYINWAYFFHAWQIAPRFASVVETHGCIACRTAWAETFPETDRPEAHAAAGLLSDAEAMLQWLEAEGIEAIARFAILPCRADGDDLLFEGSWRLPCLRQQKPGKACLCLTDFVLPATHGGNGDGVNDHVGLFATAMPCPTPTDMLCQTVCDRLAEAAAEKMHEEVRKRYWGYAPEENLPITALHREEFQGIRPAVGYPCLPDQRIIFPIHHRLRLEEIGITLTENGAMNPHAATCGLMFAHPAAHYFAVGEIGEDQRNDYERRLTENAV